MPISPAKVVKTVKRHVVAGKIPHLPAAESAPPVPDMAVIPAEAIMAASVVEVEEEVDLPSAIMVPAIHMPFKCRHI